MTMQADTNTNSNREETMAQTADKERGAAQLSLCICCARIWEPDKLSQGWGSKQMRTADMNLCDPNWFAWWLARYRNTTINSHLGKRPVASSNLHLASIVAINQPMSHLTAQVSMIPHFHSTGRHVAAFRSQSPWVSKDSEESSKRCGSSPGHARGWMKHSHSFPEKSANTVWVIKVEWHALWEWATAAHQQCGLHNRQMPALKKIVPTVKLVLVRRRAQCVGGTHTWRPQLPGESFAQPKTRQPDQARFWLSLRFFQGLRQKMMQKC